MEKVFVTTNLTSRTEKYEALGPQLMGVLEGESDLIANLANMVALIKETFDFFWVGFYLVKEQQLVLGPFQGPFACTRIDFNRGVCGAAYRAKNTILVPDVDQFPGHIACSFLSKSEIVVPIFDSKGNVMAVLDIDSEKLNDFSEVDKLGLEMLAQILQNAIVSTG